MVHPLSARDDPLVAARAAAALGRTEDALHDVAELARDAAAHVRDAAAVDATNAELAAADREAAAHERESAAQDRAAAAADRRGAAALLENAYRDGLTGTLARDAGREQLGQAVKRAQRQHEPLVVAFIDVDHLKAVNDSQGHESGDLLLREVGTVLRDGLRSYDLVVRYGGDEFVCALPGSRVDDAARRLEQAVQALATAIPGASISVGLAELEDGEILDEVVARADRDMYDRRADLRAGR